MGLKDMDHTFALLCLGAELLDQLPDLTIHLHFILVADAVLTQEVKFDVVCRLLHALYILYLPQSTDCFNRNLQ